MTGLMDPSKDAAAFQTLARDFLIQLKEYNSDQWTESSLSLQLEMQNKEAERMQVGARGAAARVGWDWVSRVGRGRGARGAGAGSVVGICWSLPDCLCCRVGDFAWTTSVASRGLTSALQPPCPAVYITTGSKGELPLSAQ